MLTKLLISILIIESVVVSALRIQNLEEEYEDMTDMTETTNLLNRPLSASMPSASSSTTTTTEKTPQICTDIKPDFISTRKGSYQTLDCSANICDGDGDDSNDIDTIRRFAQPIFDWNSQFGHIFATNGTCDYERLHCWHSIDIDLENLSHQMLDNGLNEIQLSCSVSDYLSNSDVEDDTQWAVGSDYSIVKRFKGKGLDQSCDTDIQCGDSMVCLNSDKNDGTYCQCSLDFMSGVPYVQIMDQKYEEWICMPPLMINDTCLYDQQCQGMDINTVCGAKHIDSIDFGIGTCQCAQDMLFTGTGCEPQTVDMTSRPAIIWWIFTNDEKDESSTQRFWWLKTASYMVAILSILLPISLIFIALGMLCYRKLSKKTSTVQTVIRPKFPSAAAPKIIISDFLKKEKSDDKYDLVKNDHLILQ